MGNKKSRRFTRTKFPDQSKPDQPQKRQRIKPSEDFEDFSALSSFPNNLEVLKHLPIQWRLITYMLDWQLDDIDRKVNELQESPFVIFERKSKLVQQYTKLYGESYTDEVLKKRYSEAFKKRRKAYPPKWFTDIKKKLTSSRSIRVFDKLNKIWGELWRCSWTIDRAGDRDKCFELAKRLKIEPGHVFIDPEFDPETVGKRLSYSEWEIWYYKEKMARCGILKKSGKVDRRGGPMVYASGHWHQWEGKWVAMPYLSERLFDEIVKEFGFKELSKKEKRL